MSFKKGLVFTIALALSFGLAACGGSSKKGTTTVIDTPKSTECAISEFWITGKDNTHAVITNGSGSGTIVLSMGYDATIDITKIVASFVIDSTATVKVGEKVQESGVTENDFTNPVTYVVTAEDGTTTQSYAVTISMLPEEKLMISEYFEGFSNNKYLEITNTGSTEIDLSAYTLSNVVHNSSNVAGTAITSALTGKLAAGKSAVYANGSTALGTLTVLNALPVYSDGIATSWKSIGLADTAGAINNAAGYAAGDTTIIVDAITDSANPLTVGTTFTIADETDTPTHTVTATSLTSGVTTSITFTPALVSAVADNKAVTFVDNSAIGFVTFNGNDPITLQHSGILVDRVGPADDTNFGADMVMIRKLGKTPSATYNASDWNICPFGGSAQVAGDDFSAGIYETAATGSTLNLLTFGTFRGTITGTTVTVTLTAGVPVTALVPTFITTAESVTVDGAALTSGTSTVDFSTGTTTNVTTPVTGIQYSKTFTVATGAATQAYTVNVISPIPQEYTDTNYTIAGNIATVKTAITSPTEVTFDYNVEGMVTCIKNANTIFIQDQDEGLCIFTSNIATTNSLKIGDRITVHVTKGKIYSALKEVTACDTVAVVSSGNALYWKDGSAGWDGVVNNCLYKYTGKITTRAQSGVFDTDSTGKNFRTPTTTITFLPLTSETKTFYGVIDLYNATEQMVLVAADQIRD